MITLSKIIPLTFLSIGVFLLVQVILPIVSFQVWLIGQESSHSLLISPSFSKNSQILGVSVRNKDNFPAIVSTLTRATKATYTQFTLTIPKLKIDQEKVYVDSNDLSTSLAHLPGAALPGEKGNVFISGHSALSQFFNLKKTVFANLTDLKKGDRVEVLAQGTKFQYEVIDLKVVDPKDTSVTNAPEGMGRYISLMTCVPPGLNFKRLIVLGKMI